MTCRLHYPPDRSTQRKLLWLTDLHLDGADSLTRKNFVDAIAAQQPEAILVGGDICNGINALRILDILSDLFQKRIYFVLGNHDFYYSSIPSIRQAAQIVSKEYRFLYYLTGGGVFPLTPHCGLVGHDGWSDGGSGDWEGSDVMVYDYLHIEDLKDLSKQQRRLRLQGLGRAAAMEARKDLLAALDVYKHVIFLTHPPPFPEACRYKGKTGDPLWTPHFVCSAMGEMLLEVASRYPEKQILCLCGHSHHHADIMVRDNLRIVVGDSKLGNPTITGILEVG